VSDVRPAESDVVDLSSNTPALTPARSPRSRGGNAMGRSRAAALEGARRVFAENGIRKASMGDVAVRGGLAKATLYNHFRTKDGLIAGLVADDVTELTSDCCDLARDDLATALTRAADAVSQHPVLVGLRKVEPTALLAAASPGEGTTWTTIRAQVALVLDAADVSSSDDCVDLVCRWLASHATSPGTSTARAAQARVMAAGLPLAIRTTSFATPVS
jgi:AcrR family transcriptional regulator